MASQSTIKAHYDIEDAIEHLYDVTIFEKTILTTVTNNAEAVTEWINALYSDNTVYNYIGFEVEMAAGNDTIGTVQFCVGHRCLVIQLLHMSDYPPALEKFLSDTRHTFVAVEVEFKLNLLTDQCPAIEGPVAYKDLADFAAEVFHKRQLRYAGKSVLFEVALGLEVEIPLVEADWGRGGRLSEGQVKYACLDAYTCFEIARRITSTD